MGILGNGSKYLASFYGHRLTIGVMIKDLIKDSQDLSILEAFGNIIHELGSRYVCKSVEC